jgi:hypothetical protein
MAMATVLLWLADFAVVDLPGHRRPFERAGTAFWIYAVMCAVDFVFMLAVLPETKGKSLEEIERHWLDRRGQAA